MGLKRRMGWRKFGDCPAGGPAGAWPGELFQSTLRHPLLAQSPALKLPQQPLDSLHHESQLDSGPYGHWHGCLDW